MSHENWIGLLQTGVSPVRAWHPGWLARVGRLTPAHSVAWRLPDHTTTRLPQSIHARVPNLARALDRGYGPAPMELKISLLCALTDEAISKPALR